MIHGLFLDPRAWKIDIMQSAKECGCWEPEKYGINIDLHQDAFNIPTKGIAKKYKFVIATEVWEIPMRKTLKYLKAKGLKIFFLPREPFKTDILKDAMFSYKRFFWDGEYYFTPDVILAPGQAYADLWANKTDIYITGYPRFDYYSVYTGSAVARKSIMRSYNLDPNRRKIFFPSFPPYNYKKVNKKDTMVDLFDVREQMIGALRSYAEDTDSQVIIKIHPASMKTFLKGTGNGKEVSGLLKKYYKSPDTNTVVIGDVRNNGFVSKDLLLVSSVVCGFTSTMLLEASLCNKPAIHMLFGKTAQLGGIPEYAQYIPTAKNKSELYKLLDDPSCSNNPMVEKYLYMADGKCCERICGAIRNEI